MSFRLRNIIPPVNLNLNVSIDLPFLEVDVSLMIGQAQAQHNSLEDISDDPKFSLLDMLVSAHGYEWEAFQVITDDDYVLSLVHLMGEETPTEGSVLLQHGQNFNVYAWLNPDLDEPNALRLLDYGYDVWLGENRGFDLSQGHLAYSAEQSAYWDWSFAEMGLYDVPAFVRAVKELSGEEKIYFVGHSQGATQMFYALAHLED